MADCAPPLADNRICLLGNHEEMFLGALAGPGAPRTGSTMAATRRWRPTAGDAAGGAGRHTGDARRRHPGEPPGLPRRLARSVAFGTYLFVHAGISPKRSLDDQDPAEMVWIR